MSGSNVHKTRAKCIIQHMRGPNMRLTQSNSFPGRAVILKSRAQIALSPRAEMSPDRRTLIDFNTPAGSCCANIIYFANPPTRSHTHPTQNFLQNTDVTDAPRSILMLSNFDAKVATAQSSNSSQRLQLHVRSIAQEPPTLAPAIHIDLFWRAQGLKPINVNVCLLL